MNRAPRALIAASVWITTLQGARAEPATANLVVSQRAPIVVAAPLSAASTTPALPDKLLYSAAEWQRLLNPLPELHAYTQSFEPFSSAATDKALECGKRTRSNVSAWSFVDGPFLWTVGDQKLWIVSGKIERGALLSVLSPSDAGLRHRASTIIAEPNAVLAIGLATDHPQQLLWTTCYGNPGHSGSIELTKDGQPSFVYR